MDASRENKDDEETVKRSRRRALRELNLSPQESACARYVLQVIRAHQYCCTARGKASLDSSLKRHTALIKRAKLSIGLENRDHLLKDIEGLTLEKYVEEIATSLLEGLARCKTDKDVWSATEVTSCSMPFIRVSY